jgi:1-acyl-sn-glycerol-3-phosphate acyltransferase
MFPFDSGKGHPGKVKVILNDILQPNESKEEMKKCVRINVQKHLYK